MLVKVHELRKGDEFLTTNNGSFRYYKALENPKPMAKKFQRAGSDIRYSALKCSCKMDIVEQKYAWGTTHRWERYECTPLDHNTIKRVNLEYRDIWLVDRRGS